MMEFFIISVNKQLPAIEKIFGAKNQKYKSQKIQLDSPLFMSGDWFVMSGDDQFYKWQ